VGRWRYNCNPFAIGLQREARADGRFIGNSTNSTNLKYSCNLTFALQQGLPG